MWDPEYLKEDMSYIQKSWQFFQAAPPAIHPITAKEKRKYMPLKKKKRIPASNDILSANRKVGKRPQSALRILLLMPIF